MYICILYVIIFVFSNCCKCFSLKFLLFNLLSICYDLFIYYFMYLCIYFYNNERYWILDCFVFWFRECNCNYFSLFSLIFIFIVMMYFDLSCLFIYCYYIIIFFDIDLLFIDKVNKFRFFFLLFNFCMDRNDYGDWMVNIIYWIYFKF